MIKAMVCDLDDTLFPEHEFVFSGFEAVDDWLVLNKGLEGFAMLAKRLFAEGCRGNVFDQVLELVGEPKERSLIEKMLDVYRNHQPKLRLHPDAQRLIDRYRNEMNMAIITDGYLQTQRNKVAALGINEYFSPIIYSDAYGRENWKPSEVPYHNVMAETGFAGYEHVYIGDNPLKDFIAPKKLGWLTIRVIRADGQYAQQQVTTDREAVVLINSLDQITDAILHNGIN